MYKITKDKLEQTLSWRINELQAEIKALKEVTINTEHKILTNRAVKGGVIGDYIGIGKALYVYYQFRKDGVSLSSQKTDITAYTYNNPDGTEIGSEGGLRISRTMTPVELKEVLDAVISAREVSLGQLKKDLDAADSIVARYNKIADDLTELENSTSYATHGVFHR